MALIDKTLGELKEIGFYFGLKGVAPTQTKAKMIEKIEAYLAENPDVSLPTDEEVGQVKKEVLVEAVQAHARISDYPRRKVIIESRDPEQQHEVFSVNEYLCDVQMGKEIMIPIPVIDMIKGLKDIRHTKDEVTGFSKTEYVPKFFVSFV